MEELQPQDLQELVQELEGESEEEEALSPEVETLLRRLGPWNPEQTRRDAAAQLGRVGTSSPQIVQALIAACDSPSALVSTAATKSLRAPVHQECLQQHPELAAAADSALQQAPDWLKDTLSGQGSDRSVSRRKKPVSNFHIGLMISAGVVLLGIGIAGVQAGLPAGMPRTWGDYEFMGYVKLLSLLCLLPGVVLSGWALWNWLAPWGARNVFRRSMKETSVAVYRAWREEQTNQWGGHTGYKYFVKISLQADAVHGDSRDILLKLRVKRPIWESLQADMTVSARYAAENPRIALIQGEW